jgi:hypothetical protein
MWRRKRGPVKEWPEKIWQEKSIAREGVDGKGAVGKCREGADIGFVVETAWSKTWR